MGLKGTGIELMEFFSRTPKCPGSYPRLGITAVRQLGYIYVLRYGYGWMRPGLSNA
jgi:hypothetical protein